MNRIPMLAAGHATVDLYQGAVPALVPFLVAERGYGYVAVSGVVLAATLSSSIVQPVFGVLTDRWRMPWLIPVSMVVAGAGVAAGGVADSYVLTWLAVALSGLGVAAYHPESARLARIASAGSHVRMSWFSLGGTLGFASAPVLVTPLLALWGLEASPFLVLPAVLGALVTLPAIRASAAGPGPEAGAAAPVPGRDDWPSFTRLTLVIVFRSVVYVGLSAFVALYMGGGASGAVALFVLFAGGAVGTVLGGRLAGRWGRVRTMRLAYAAAVPAVAGVVLAPGPAAYVFIAASSIALYAPFSLHVTLGQDFLPRRVGTASGVTLGLAVSVGGLASPLVGAVAEAATLRTALACLIVFPLLAWLLARTLKEPALEPAS
ncbi:FSR family fosmidomycin resistance protein-like MFS transporter [Nonomuraea polychroma]|uniref:FSR family fosmidomycin resistance protein-like MFS transporter n=1 Tax=Nonomuraea polychroma TaxID=46176 RepID=A0A438M152_9ACTN|nr:MFS transporter [Nonomuraea polychroma]RVX39540.1 FSR family fosmidomycin resistance protein-like MFS transporter [Nonomuraea polychroma]